MHFLYYKNNLAKLRLMRIFYLLFELTQVSLYVFKTTSDSLRGSTLYRELQVDSRIFKIKSLKIQINLRHIAFLAAFGATTIYGINHTVAKGVMPDYVGSFGFIFLRTGGAAMLFWISSLFVKTETIEKKDWKMIILAAVLGACINMLAFFKGLELSTPINSSILVTITPI